MQTSQGLVPSLGSSPGARSGSSEARPQQTQHFKAGVLWGYVTDANAHSKDRCKLRNLCGQLSDHAGINLQGELAPEVELRAEGLGLEGGLQGGECHLQLLISREQGKVHKGVRAQLLGPTKQTAACAHTAMSEWMDGWMDGWMEGRKDE